MPLTAISTSMTANGTAAAQSRALSMSPGLSAFAVRAAYLVAQTRVDANNNDSSVTARTMLSTPHPTGPRRQ